MSVVWRMDLIAGAGCRVTLDGAELTRVCIVSGLPITAGDSDPAVIAKIVDDSGFPGYGSVLPAAPSSFTGATLQDVVVRSRDKKTSSVEVGLTYRRRGNGADPGLLSSWTLEDSGTISHSISASTADGSQQIQVWYFSGTASTVETAPAGADIKNIQMPIMRPSRVLRATAHMLKTQWDDFKIPVRQTVGGINSVAWGSTDRGTWFHSPITVTTSDRNKSVTITLTFLEQPLGWYGLGVYHQAIDGKIPKDIASENDVRSAGPPPEGTMNRRNGIVLASQYKEFDFNLYPFTPDDV